MAQREVINQVSKLPRLESFYSGTLSFGNGFLFRTTGDINQRSNDTSAFHVNFMAYREDGFLSTRPEGKFVKYNRHMRAREIGHLVAKIGQQGVLEAGDHVLEHDLLLGIVSKDVQKKMGRCRHSTTLKFAW